MIFNPDLNHKVLSPQISYLDLDLERICIFSTAFPPLHKADANGLLCIGGDLSPERLLAGYANAIFPWYNEDSPILWWSLDPRCVLLVEKFHLPKRSLRTIRNANFEITINQDFEAVIRACAEPRRYNGKVENETWINQAIKNAYLNLHKLGYAHSIETWQVQENGEKELVGGLYGVGLAKIFFGESMFHRVPEASRAALNALISFLKMLGVSLIDSQQATEHMLKMGAECWPRIAYNKILRQLVPHPFNIQEVWQPWSYKVTNFNLTTNSWYLAD